MTARTTSVLRIRTGLLAVGLAVTGAAPSSGVIEDESTIREVAELRDGRRVTGRLVVAAAGAIAFEPDSGGEAIPLDRIGRLERSPESAAPPAVPESQPFILSTGFGERLSGRLVGLDEETVRMAVGDDGEVVVDRGGVVSLVQRPGEARQIAEDFEEPLDRDRWVGRRNAEVGPDPDAEGAVLRLGSEEAEARLRLPEPIDAGRVELSFAWEDRRSTGRRWFVDLIFGGPNGEEITRVVLGWADPFPSVESRGGPEIVVQPLILEPGWHRFSARFGPDRTLLAIDGDELGRGKGRRGSLVALRLGTEAARDAEAANDLVARVDDLIAVRSFEPTTTPEIDPTQDEARMVTGDQLWGTILSADDEGLRLLVLDRPIDAPWSQVAGLYFRREPGPAAMRSGPLVRVDWEAGDPDRRADRIEGALVGLDDTAYRVATPYAGTIAVPRPLLRRLEVLGRGSVLVIDPFARHLGDQLKPELDPPMPDGDRLEIPFTLDEPPGGAAELVIDAVQVEGEFEGGQFVEDLGDGYLRTNLLLNGREFDYLNRHVRDPNRTPSRIRVPLPADLLRPGENTLSFEQVGRKNEAEYRDDLGLLRIALEWPEGDERP